VDWVDLAPLDDPNLVPQAILAALSIPERTSRSLPDILIDAVADKEALLVLDNCEHLIQSCAQIVDRLLQACPNLVILTTSREPLRLPQEKVLVLSPLPVPEPDLKEVEALRGNDSVRFFIQRVTAVSPSFEITPANANWVALICRRLDGIPLALEMCAARARTFSVEQLAVRLDNRFQLLSEGSRTALPRQQTLLATIDWSYELLSQEGQAFLRRLSVFAGGWSLEAAEAVAGDCLPDGQIPGDLLAHLVVKSFVVADLHTAEPRYAMLDTIRQYAHQKLIALGEDAPARQSHRAYFLSQATRPASWLVTQQMEREHDNFRTALADAIQCNDRESALRLGIGLGRFWELSGYWSEGRQWLERSLALTVDADDRLTCQALNVSSLLARRQGHFDPARQWAQSALDLAQRREDVPSVIQALNNLGHVAYYQGDYERVRELVRESARLFDSSAGTDPGCLADAWRLSGNIAFNQANFIEARQFYEKCLAIYREQDDLPNIALLLNNLGLTDLYLGDVAQAQSTSREGLALSERINDQRSIAIARVSLGHIALNQNDLEQAHSDYSASCLAFSNLGDLSFEAEVHFYIGITALRGENFEEAHLHFSKSLEQRRRLKSKQGVAEALHGLGHLAMVQGQFEQARTLMKESLTARVELGDKLGIAFSLIDFAQLTLQKPDLQDAQAVIWLGAVQSILDTAHSHLSPYDQQAYDETCQAERDRLEQERFSADWEQGRSLSASQAGELALTWAGLNR
jgi:non-specific serine/threonine protein kinase